MNGIQDISDLIHVLNFHESRSIFNVTSTTSKGIGVGSEGGEGSEIIEISNEISTWTAWISSVFLLLVSLVGLPLNGATVGIFWRRKKLRSLVNFQLLLDCLSHIFLCLVCIPIHVVTSVWKLPGKRMPWSCLALLTVQQVVGTFANLFGLLLTLSISILRYRRLCWKKKDKFSTINAMKWSGTILSVAIGFTLIPYLVTQPQKISTLTLLYSIKLSLVLLSILVVFFCYMRVIQRVWSSGTQQEEKVMDASKLKKSRIVRMLATFHSCVQIILVMMTVTPYLYEEAMEALKDQREDDDKGTSYNHTDRLLAITVNYILLVLGTPLAYIASCHRFREQFTSSILFILGHSPSKSPLYLTRQSTAPSTQQQGFRSDSQKSSIKTKARHQNNNNYCPFHYNFSRDSSLLDRNKNKRQNRDVELEQDKNLNCPQKVETVHPMDILIESGHEHGMIRRKSSGGRRGSILDSLKPCSSLELPSSSSSSPSPSSSSDHTLDSKSTTNGFQIDKTKSSESSSFSSQTTSTLGTLSTGSGSPKQTNVNLSLPLELSNNKKNFCQNLKQEYHKTILVSKSNKTDRLHGHEFGDIV